MARPEAYPITYGVLGLLAFWGPMSGYDIKRLFDHVLAPMWGAAHSQIYHELRRMNELGWVDMEREEQEARPDRKVYAITDSGQEALAAWQVEQPDEPQMRDELLLKVLFGTFADPQALAANLRRAITSHEMRLLEYRNMQFLPVRRGPYHAGSRPNPYAAESQEDPFFPLITQFAVEFEIMYLKWLYKTLGFLENSGDEDRLEQ
jgi:PadR family transcriptional regulator AphA